MLHPCCFAGGGFVVVSIISHEAHFEHRQSKTQLWVCNLHTVSGTKKVAAADGMPAEDHKVPGRTATAREEFKAIVMRQVLNDLQNVVAQQAALAMAQGDSFHDPLTVCVGDLNMLPQEMKAAKDSSARSLKVLCSMSGNTESLKATFPHVADRDWLIANFHLRGADEGALKHEPIVAHDGAHMAVIGAWDQDSWKRSREKPQGETAPDPAVEAGIAKIWQAITTRSMARQRMIEEELQAEEEQQADADEDVDIADADMVTLPSRRGIPGMDDDDDDADEMAKKMAKKQRDVGQMASPPLPPPLTPLPAVPPVAQPPRPHKPAPLAAPPRLAAPMPKTQAAAVCVHYNDVKLNPKCKPNFKGPPPVLHMPPRTQETPPSAAPPPAPPPPKTQETPPPANWERRTGEAPRTQETPPPAAPLPAPPPPKTQETPPPPHWNRRTGDAQEAEEEPPNWDRIMSPTSPADRSPTSPADEQGAASASALATTQGDNAGQSGTTTTLALIPNVENRFARRDGLPNRVFVQRVGELYVVNTADRAKMVEYIREALTIRREMAEEIGGAFDITTTILPWAQVRVGLARHRSKWLNMDAQRNKAWAVWTAISAQSQGEEDNNKLAENTTRTMRSKYQTMMFETFGGQAWFVWLVALGEVCSCGSITLGCGNS